MFEQMNLNKYTRNLLKTQFKDMREIAKRGNIEEAIHKQWFIIGIATGLESTKTITENQRDFITKLSDRILLRKFFPETLKKTKKH